MTCVTNVTFTPAPPDDQRRGLLGWVRIELDGRIGIDGFLLRRTQEGGTRLCFPERVDRAGRRHPVVWPLDERTRREIEAQILAEVPS